ncbi:major facilitator superfamily MFS_1 [Hymenobacter roseosalivarius DSM 11622]|uniref:Major facilitator superfamily MFS_1 n=1 Tax=Hymenobacter roseosalivarius DSM 11622 TaxID=645990 RepID=A0A1W1W3A8_9BACT|nr:MFS transporter [Hymenobacter roseosalivarius]SMC00108.1 major facilitator superfamily MFS_1 [Hymenobacter roseosalivarius DSM 11622]
MPRILPVIVLAQFFCTSLWFAGNAIAADLAAMLQQPPTFVADLTSAVQLGFISGTLVFALLAIADRFSPSRVFCFSALAAALCNLGINLAELEAGSLLTFRFLTGFFLAGIYPVGMKIAADYVQASLSKWLGFLVGALVLGTAFPHLLKSVTSQLPWQYVTLATSGLAVLGGLAMLLLVPDGPYRRTRQRLQVTAFLSGFRLPRFRAAAFGYFGHMWELYTFWAFLPLMLTTYNSAHPGANLPVSLLSFLLIGAGGLACMGSGLLSLIIAPRTVATTALALSGLCCLVSPLVLRSHSGGFFLSFLFCWGLVVVADSPMFSSLVAQSAPDASRGTALTIVNCIGFALTVVSIQVTSWLSDYVQAQDLYLLLAVGPALGLLAQLGSRREVATGA